MDGRRDRIAGRLTLVLLSIALLAAFALSLWGTVVRPPAYEVRGVFVARPAPNTILVRHAAVAALAMNAMELMAIVGEPRTIDAAGVAPGDLVKLAVRRRDDDLVLIRIEKIR